MKSAQTQKQITPLVSNKVTKDDFVYIRVDRELSQKIATIQKKKKFTNRSQAIRAILVWAFENEVERA